MSSEFVGRPRLLKAALVALDPSSPGSLPSIVTFQYNPDRITRTVAPRAPPGDPASAGGAREDVLRIQGPPVETIRMTATLDAADQLESPRTNPLVPLHGLHPQLASLELLLHPGTMQLLKAEAMAMVGEEERARQHVPLLLLVWGAARVVPVQLVGLSITEEAHDPLLNPIRASVELSMRVLTSADVAPRSLGHGAYMAYQAQKEALSKLGAVGSAIAAADNVAKLLS